jgi:hypothetical protein
VGWGVYFTWVQSGRSASRCSATCSESSKKEETTPSREIVWHKSESVPCLIDYGYTLHVRLVPKMRRCYHESMLCYELGDGRCRLF